MLAQYFPPDMNGGSTRVYNAARALLFQGCNVTVVTTFRIIINSQTQSKHKGKIITQEDIDGIKVIRTWIPNLSHSSIIQRIFLHISFMLSSLLGLMIHKESRYNICDESKYFRFFSCTPIQNIISQKHHSKC